MKAGLNRLFDELNRTHWRGRLPKYRVVIFRSKSTGKLGAMMGYPPSILGARDINRREIFLWRGLAGEELRTTLLHEMCHIGPSTRNAHGMRFLLKIARLIRRGEQELLQMLSDFRTEIQELSPGQRRRLARACGSDGRRTGQAKWFWIAMGVLAEMQE